MKVALCLSLVASAAAFSQVRHPFASIASVVSVVLLGIIYLIVYERLGTSVSVAHSCGGLTENMVDLPLSSSSTKRHAI
jgi:hypothetical protein